MPVSSNIPTRIYKRHSRQLHQAHQHKMAHLMCKRPSINSCNVWKWTLHQRQTRLIAFIRWRLGVRRLKTHLRIRVTYAGALRQARQMIIVNSRDCKLKRAPRHPPQIARRICFRYQNTARPSDLCPHPVTRDPTQSKCFSLLQTSSASASRFTACELCSCYISDKFMAYQTQPRLYHFTCLQCSAT